MSSAVIGIVLIAVAGQNSAMRNQRAKRSTIRGSAAKTSQNVEMTLQLPRQLYERVKNHVGREETGAVNDFIAEALAAYLRAVERKAIDDSFSGMAHDKRYQREALRIVQEFGG